MSWNLNVTGTAEDVTNAVRGESYIPSHVADAIVAAVELAGASAGKRTAECAKYDISKHIRFGVSLKTSGHIDEQQYHSIIEVTHERLS